MDFECTNKIKWNSEYLKRKAMKADRLCKFIEMFQKANFPTEDGLQHAERDRSHKTGFFR